MKIRSLISVIMFFQLACQTGPESTARTTISETNDPIQGSWELVESIEDGTVVIINKASAIQDLS